MRRVLASAVTAFALCGPVRAADPGYYVVTVYSEPGVRTVELRHWSFKQRGSPAVLWPEVGVGWNVNSRWHTHLLASGIGSSDMATRLSTLQWQNDVLLTQGEWPFDLALHTLYTQARAAWDEHAFQFGPVLQTDVGRTQLNANVFWERSFGTLAHRPLQLKYQWQVRHRWRPWLHVGAQGFGELGDWNHWADRDAQSHRAGPALFGTVSLGSRSLGWQAAYLVGSTYAQHGRLFSLRVKLDF